MHTERKGVGGEGGREGKKERKKAVWVPVLA